MGRFLVIIALLFVVRVARGHVEAISASRCAGVGPGDIETGMSVTPRQPAPRVLKADYHRQEGETCDKYIECESLKCDRGLCGSGDPTTPRPTPSTLPTTKPTPPTTQRPSTTTKRIRTPGLPGAACFSFTDCQSETCYRAICADVQLGTTRVPETTTRLIQTESPCPGRYTRPPYGTCTSDCQCQSGHCVRNRCMPLPHRNCYRGGMVCMHDDDCVSNVCSRGICAAESYGHIGKAALGTACMRKEQCDSGFCDGRSGMCAMP